MKALASAVAESGRWGGRGLLKVAPCFRISILYFSFHHYYQFSAIASTVHEAGAGWRRFENVRARQRASDSICDPESSGEKVTCSGWGGLAGRGPGGAPEPERKQVVSSQSEFAGKREMWLHRNICSFLCKPGHPKRGYCSR